jgi:hypothetical protein
MATQTDYERTLAALEDCRWSQMRIIADAAEEAGDDQLARGWRWLADNRKWPEENPPGPSGAWSFSWYNRPLGRPGRPPGPERQDELPREVYGGLTVNSKRAGKGSMLTYCQPLRVALEAAARAASEWLASVDN